MLICAGIKGRPISANSSAHQRRPNDPRASVAGGDSISKRPSMLVGLNFIRRDQERQLRHSNYESTAPLADGAHLADDLVGYVPGQDDKICGCAIKHELWCDDRDATARKQKTLLMGATIRDKHDISFSHPASV